MGFLSFSPLQHRLIPDSRTNFARVLVDIGATAPGREKRETVRSTQLYRRMSWYRMNEGQTWSRSYFMLWAEASFGLGRQKRWDKRKV